MEDKCKGKNKAGQRCKATKQSGSNYCFFHDPEKKAARDLARSQGGRKKADLSRADVLKTMITDVETSQERNDKPKINVRTFSDIIDWCNKELNEIEETKKYARQSAAERKTSLDRIEMIRKCAFEQILAQLRELEKTVYREGENDRRF